ncbi:hypothetical protein DM02DRAFT_551138 [Periconia macrospinosa]|uniref:Zn(2)-C6 fungal-type domain-containing protein n=1 Tax=Periconia macrospinosa TaxID=97972 RepID=A0A2V1EAX7_9PLEO|nr:hypothetical protein DM02DRAFT_551138 [Periconia macrospinosa]
MRSHDGCWTCKVRKKRCDELRPVCRNCSTLEITCHFGNQKPSWMDNGNGQKEKAKEVKREVKSAAARRRGTVLTDALEPVPSTSDRGITLIADSSDAENAFGMSPLFRGEPFSESAPSWISAHTEPNAEPSSSNANQDFWNKSNRLLERDSSDDQPGDSELDRRFMMFYFDHFFPFLFPFYKPPILEGGRSWIMELVVGSEAMWHTTLCLSTYFVSISLDGAISDKTLCKSLAWEKLLKQLGVTFTMLQRNLREVTLTNTADSLVKVCRIMGSIIQLQRFEISVGNFQNCEQHLGAAIALFKEAFRIAENLTDREESPTLRGLLSRIGRPIWTVNSRSGGAWSTDQAAFRFYSALLIVDDIISSTCMTEPPRLSRYHAQCLFANDHSPEARSPLNLEDFMGCENWVLLQISEISALDAWKKSMKKAGQLDMMELVARASVIKQCLLGYLTRLEATTNIPNTNPPGFFAFFNDQLPPMPGGCSAFVTRVWAHAALLYLSVTVSGWQPASLEIRNNMTRILALLEQMPEPKLLRTVAWPFCFAGCLAESDEEYRFRAMADALVPHQLFGAARKALEIMESVWKCRYEVTIDTDFAACVSSMGYISLLV